MHRLSLILLLSGAVLLSQSFYMDAKARLAQILIAHSWQLGVNNSNTAKDGPPPKPWWWADTRAIAKLEVPRLDKTVFVMQDDSGESLAFGPGHMPASSAPAADGHVMIAGHRDSHFAFLQHVRPGDVIRTEDYRANEKRYQVTSMDVFDTEMESLQRLDRDQLSLITCYPFDGWVPGGPLRFIVTAVAL